MPAACHHRRRCFRHADSPACFYIDLRFDAFPIFAILFRHAAATIFLPIFLSRCHAGCRHAASFCFMAAAIAAATIFCRAALLALPPPLYFHAAIHASAYARLTLTASQLFIFSPRCRRQLPRRQAAAIMPLSSCR